MGSEKVNVLDALIVGAGFSGCHVLWKLRQLGFSAKIYEWGKELGGTWYWNRYPGARVDSETPAYMLPEEKDGWIDFEWKERFPGREELMSYFRHIDKKLELSKDIIYNTFVKDCKWNESTCLWKITTDTGLETYAKYLILCTGFAAKRYTPPFKGLERFGGAVHHSSLWPEEEVDLTGKKVAVIGTGASGVQIIQKIGPVVEHLTVYQRTPNLAIPMRQAFKEKDESVWKFPEKGSYERIFTDLTKTFGAVIVDMDFTTKKFNECSPEERWKLYQYLWDYGGFAFWICGFLEVFFEQKVNDEVYAFWLEKTRGRIKDQKKRDLLAPKSAPHAWGTKRPCLETSYFEVFNQENVDVINLKQSPIVEITETGVKTMQEGVVDVDVLILATGFDSITGGILNINIVNGKGESIQDKWKEGTSSYLGMCTSGFTNMFWTYGPQGPTAFSNGPTSATIQGNWIAHLLKHTREQGLKSIEPSKEAEDDWVKLLKAEWLG